MPGSAAASARAPQREKIRPILHKSHLKKPEHPGPKSGWPSILSLNENNQVKQVKQVSSKNHSKLMETTATNRVSCVTIYQGTLTYLVPSITCDNMHHNKSNFVGKQIQFHRKTKIDQPACGNNERKTDDLLGKAL